MISNINRLVRFMLEYYFNQKLSFDMTINKSKTFFFYFLQVRKPNQQPNF